MDEYSLGGTVTKGETEKEKGRERQRDKDYLLELNDCEGKWSPAYQSDLLRLILLCLYFLNLHSQILSPNCSYLHSNPTLLWPTLHASTCVYV